MGDFIRLAGPPAGVPLWAWVATWAILLTLSGALGLVIVLALTGAP